MESVRPYVAAPIASIAPLPERKQLLPCTAYSLAATCWYLALPERAARHGQERQRRLLRAGVRLHERRAGAVQLAVRARLPAVLQPLLRRPVRAHPRAAGRLRRAGAEVPGGQAAAQLPVGAAPAAGQPVLGLPVDGWDPGGALHVCGARARAARPAGDAGDPRPGVLPRPGAGAAAARRPERRQLSRSRCHHSRRCVHRGRRAL